MPLSTEGKKKVLLVDDEASYVETVKARLLFEGYEVTCARDGHEGLEKACMEHPDIILLDVAMPKLSGYQVCHKLKEHDGTKDIPIIMLTARAQEDDKAAGEEVGADAYIVKPFEMGELLGMMKKLLGME